MKTVLDTNSVVGWNKNALIILADSGIFYTAQCGGLSCNHPEAEGYCIDMGDFADDFDTCSYGCAYLPEMPEKQKQLGIDFNEYCAEACKRWTWKLRFDFERVAETQEGWIPVIANGEFWGLDGEKFDNAKGFFHNGNCD